MKLASMSLMSLQNAISLCIVASTIAACGGSPQQSTESTESSDSTEEVLPDATALQALETGSPSLPDTDAQQTALSATVPDSCSDSKSSVAYQSGEKLGARWVQWMWKHYRCCDRVEKFDDALTILVEKIQQWADAEKGVPQCWHMGIVAGALEAMDSVETQCQDSCSAKGETTGAAAAKTYCDQAIGAGGQLQPPTWTRQPVGICGLAYEMACDAKFLGTTTSYVNGQGACAPYTRDPYSEIWNLTRLQSCDYYRRSSSK